MARLRNSYCNKCWLVRQTDRRPRGRSGSNGKRGGVRAGGIDGGCGRQKGISEVQLRSSSPASGVNSIYGP